MCIPQAKGFAKLVEWRTKKGIDDPSLIPIGKALPKFRHHSTYDNAPSHHKRDPHALNINSIAKGDGHGKYRIHDTTWKGEVQSLVILVEGGEPINKGRQTIGFERGHGIKTARSWARRSRSRSPRCATCSAATRTLPPAQPF